MTAVTDSYTGLQLVELSHKWGHGAPSYPGQADVKMFRAVKHAQHGVLAWKVNTVMHTGTHMNAPIHLIQRGADRSHIHLRGHPTHVVQLTRRQQRSIWVTFGSPADVLVGHPFEPLPIRLALERNRGPVRTDFDHLTVP